MTARPYKSLLKKKLNGTETGHPHREHRSKKGRTNLARKKANIRYKRRIEELRLKELERERRRMV